MLLTASTIVGLSASVSSRNHVEWKYLSCAVIVAFVVMVISWLALRQANNFKLGWVRGAGRCSACHRLSSQCRLYATVSLSAFRRAWSSLLSPWLSS